jgi:Ca-activated chloride channel homolog
VFEFAWPWIFLLAPLPWFILRFAPAQEHQEAALRVPFFSHLATINDRPQQLQSPIWFNKTLLMLIWLCCVAAAARPQWLGEPLPLEASGRDLLLAVDISESMNVPDMQLGGETVTRWDAVKLVVGDFVKRREQDRLGLVLFGGNAYLQAPLTFDRQAVKTFLLEAQLGFAGRGTAIGDAIGLAVKRLRERPSASRVMVLLTDGANNAGEIDPRQAANLAKIAGVKIYTVGVGADEMIQETFFGRQKVNPSADLDAELLGHIAAETGGLYFRARNPEELAKIYAELDKLEPIDQEEETYRPIKALYFWFLSVALITSFILAIATSGLFSRLISVKPVAGKKQSL